MTAHLLRPLRVALLLVTLGSASAVAPAVVAAGPAAQSAHAATAQRLQQLTVHITATGSTVWGTVNLRYTYQGHTVQRSTSQALSSFRIPRGVAVHLTQRPLDAVTWPFEQWTIVRGAQTLNRAAPATSFKMKGNSQITAVYFFN